MYPKKISDTFYLLFTAAKAIASYNAGEFPEPGSRECIYRTLCDGIPKYQWHDSSSSQDLVELATEFLLLPLPYIHGNEEEDEVETRNFQRQCEFIASRLLDVVEQLSQKEDAEARGG